MTSQHGATCRTLELRASQGHAELQRLERENRQLSLQTAAADIGGRSQDAPHLEELEHAC